MPTKKPVVQTVLDEEIFEKFTKIAEKEKRSKSQLTAIAVEEFIEKYETAHGQVQQESSISKIG
ncbi:unknown [Bacteroides pectinophilus CAG:437]|uniref:Uncharacterized protein n=1 Tax=Bacteroides pectinophilus CAG:437 TaxID=1263051 RepID=R7ACY5_9FIRM|nr:unknown [Bacteroides pectinophilus CAG:437]